MLSWIGRANRKKRRKSKLTWNNIPGIHRILVFDEAEAVHELDLGNLTRAMAAKVFFDFLFGDWKESNTKMGQMQMSALCGQTNCPRKGAQRQRCPWCVVSFGRIFLPRGVLQTGHVLLFRVREKVHGKN